MKHWVYLPLEYQTIPQSYQKKNKTEWIAWSTDSLSADYAKKMLPKKNSLQHSQVCKQSRRNTGMSQGQQSAWGSPDFWCNQQKNRTVRTDDIPACIIFGKNKQVLLQISLPPTKGHADHCPSLWMCKRNGKWKSIVRLWYTGLSDGLPEYENRKQSVLYKVNSEIYRS